MKKILLVALLLLGSFLPASSSHGADDVTMYFFWGAGCPHCKKEKAFLQELKQKYPTLDIKAFETKHNKKHAKLYTLMAKAYGVKPLGVPATFLGEHVWIGFSQRIGLQIEEETKKCFEDGCGDPIERLSLKKPRSHAVEHQASLSSLQPVCVHAFLNPKCPQCKRVRPILKRMEERHNVEVTIHDVNKASDLETFRRFLDRYELEISSYPTVFIGNRAMIGQRAVINNLRREIEHCSKEGCPCPIETKQAIAPYPPRPKDITLGGDGRIDLPLIGTVDASKLSLPAFTVIIGGLDGFNPCAFFVLFILLGMLIHARSRKRMLIVGGTFVFFSGAIYFLFMSAWLNLFLLIGTIAYVTAIAGVVALIIGGINVKDYFFFKKGASLSIPESAKPKLFDRMRKLMRADSIVSMLIGTVVLALVANTYELLCTAGFPMVFTRVITMHDLTGLERYLYLVLYNLIYVIPLLVIVLVFVITLGARKLKESEGRMLKLISGLMMLALGGVLLIKPGLLNNAFVAIALLGGVIIVTALIILINWLARRRPRLPSQPPSQPQTTP
jgi:glutaredoxin